MTRADVVRLVVVGALVGALVVLMAGCDTDGGDVYVPAAPVIVHQHTTVVVPPSRKTVYVPRPVPVRPVAPRPGR